MQKNGGLGFHSQACSVVAQVSLSGLLRCCAGRSVLYTSARIRGQALLLATSHLESPIPGALHTAERTAQLREGISVVASQGQAEVVYAGDTNWNVCERWHSAGGVAHVTTPTVMTHPLHTRHTGIHPPMPH